MVGGGGGGANVSCQLKCCLCKLSVKFWAICQLLVKLLLIIN